MIGFCLSYSVKNCSPLDRFVRPQLVSLIIHLQFGCIHPCSCLCSSICRQGLAFVVRSTGQRMVDNQETTWCFDCGLRSCWSEAGSLVSCRRQIDSYPPDGRSGAPVPIKWYSETGLPLGLHLSFSSSVFCLSSHSPLPYLFPTLQPSAP